MKVIFINIVNDFLTTSAYNLTFKINLNKVYIIDSQCFMDFEFFGTLVNSGILQNVNFKNFDEKYGPFFKKMLQKSTEICILYSSTIRRFKIA